MTEAPLAVTTHGGAADLGRVRASTLSVGTRGGCVTGALTGCAVDVESGGGHISLTSLNGERLLVSSSGGNVNIGAMYGTFASIDTGKNLWRASLTISPRLGRARPAGDQQARAFIQPAGGGSLALRSIRCEDAKLRTAGGEARLQSADGSFELSTDGGLVEVRPSRCCVITCIEGCDGPRPFPPHAPREQVHVQENLLEARISTSGGDVLLKCSPTFFGAVLLEAGTLATDPRDPRWSVTTAGTTKVVSLFGASQVDPGTLPALHQTGTTGDDARESSLTVDAGMSRAGSEFTCLECSCHEV